MGDEDYRHIKDVPELTLLNLLPADIQRKLVGRMSIYSYILLHCNLNVRIRLTADNQQSAFKHAIQHGYVNILKYYNRHGFFINYTNHICEAIRLGYIDIVAWMLIHGAQINDASLFTATIASDSLDMVEFVIKGLIRIPKSTSTINMILCRCKNIAIVDYVISNINVDLPNLMGYAKGDACNIDLIKHLHKKYNQYISADDIVHVIYYNFRYDEALTLFVYYVENGVKFSKDILHTIISRNSTKIIHYMHMNGMLDKHDEMIVTLSTGYVEQLRFVVENGYIVTNRAIISAIDNNHMESFDFLVGLGGMMIHRNLSSNYTFNLQECYKQIISVYSRGRLKEYLREKNMPVPEGF